ncbi:MAG: glycine--tRNA ligase subunit beta [Methylococcales bacterium]|nr:glycine--tRNA ligase subunit beta [Methylococcales bacterium]MDP3838925.1 glycine--tRNA ligase subunit beta [Methylococcales bacterium]
MVTQQHLLFELGSEELPPKTLLKLSNALLDGIVQGLNAAELGFTASKAYCTPRRLAVFIENLASSQPDKTVEKRGPAIQAAFAPDGSPSKAALGFATSCGTTFDQLERLKTDKGEWLSYTQAVKGQNTEELIADIIRTSIANLPIAKRMRWGSFTTEFVRPVHWAVLLYGDKVIETEILGLQTGATTQGHRFHAPHSVSIDKPENYADILYTQGKVIADIEQRKAIIKDAATSAAANVGGIAHIEADLLEEIAALNEFPVPITGGFHDRFLALPAEVLITTMQTNQKYFPVKNADGGLLAHFITFSNIESTRPESIQQGNERVVTPRLADAEFFWNQDRKQTLAERVLSLSNIVFQEKLGTVADKTHRVIKLAEFIAQHLNADVELAKRAALLAKADLLTSMVGEFGNLQGIMGRYYALAEGEASEVAWALEEQYFPKQSGSPTASSTTGQILAIAEKIDTLTGIFSAGLIPTGDKDPYALRRAALGSLRTLIENDLTLDIRKVIEFSLSLFTHSFDVENTETAVVDFVFDRLKGYCLDKGYSADEFDAVMTVKPADPLDFMQRLAAVKAFRQLPEAESLAAANKRIRNILKKSESPAAATIGALVEAAEVQLLSSAKQSAVDIAPLLAQHDYSATLARLAALRNDVDAFFDSVMVMCDDVELRANRLALLNLLSEQFLTCADISKLQS